MAVVRYSTFEFSGLSGDTKPPDAPSGSTFVETDTANLYKKGPLSAQWVLIPQATVTVSTSGLASQATQSSMLAVLGATNGPAVIGDLDGTIQQHLRGINSQINTKIPTNGQKAMTASFPVVIANNQSPVPVSGSVSAAVTTIPASAYLTDSIASAGVSGFVVVYDATLNSGAGGYVACTVKRFFADAAASGTNQSLVSAVTSPTNAKLRVLRLKHLCGSTATTFKLVGDPAGTPVALTPNWSPAANGGSSDAFDPHGHVETAAGKALGYTTGAGSTTGIQGSYVEVFV